MPNDKNTNWMEEEETLLSISTDTEGDGDLLQKKPLSVADLYKTEKLEFILKDGTVIYFRDANDMDATDSVLMQRMQKIIMALLKRLEKNPNDKDALRRYNQASSEFVRFILPDIPEDLLSDLKEGQKGKILKYWTDNSEGRKPGK